MSAISGELTTGLSTHNFLKLLKKTSGKDLKEFSDQWIYGAGSPKLDCSYTFNRKKNIIELRVEQDRSRVKFVGNLIVRVHEPDGTFDHVVQIDDWSHRFSLLYRTKYKRLRNNKKAQMREEKMQRELEEREKAEGLRPPPGTEQDEDMCLNDPELQAELRKADWIKEGAGDGEQDAVVMNYSILWIRLDPDMELLLDISFKQADYMWNQQLTKDKDVVAQYDAVRNIVKLPTYKMCSCLFSFLMDVKSFYRIRMEAAHMMARGFALHRLDDVGVKLLFLAYRKKYCVSVGMVTPNSLPTFVPKRNDFRTFTEYYVQKSINTALAYAKSDRPILSSTIRTFLLDQLKLNDNTQNPFSDAYYVSSLIEAVGNSYLITASFNDQIATLPPQLRGPSLEDALSELDRHLFMETQLPSYRNVVANSCLNVMISWMVNGLIPLETKPFILFSRSGNFIDVRLTALSGLVVVGLSAVPEEEDVTMADDEHMTIKEEIAPHPEVEAVARYLMYIIRNDTHYVRYAVVRCMTAYITGLAAIVKQRRKDKEDMEKEKKEELEKLEAAKEENGEPEIEDLSSGITKQVEDFRKSRGEEAERVFKQLASLKVFRQGMWELLR